jgi:chemotaxis signal transduction protein
VLFAAGETTYAIPVEAAGGVLEHEGVEPLPDPLPDVVGLLRTGAEALPVLAPFGAAGEHVLVVDGGDGRFALVVGHVIGIRKVSRTAIAPAPAGQQTPIVAGVVRTDRFEALLLDPAALGRRLERA